MKPTALILLLFTPLIAAAQAPSWLESSLYSGGKINTVIAVVAVIIIGLSLWMFMMDRRCLLYTSPSPRDRTRSRMPSSA